MPNFGETPAKPAVKTTEEMAIHLAGDLELVPLDGEEGEVKKAEAEKASTSAVAAETPQAIAEQAEAQTVEDNAAADVLAEQIKSGNMGEQIVEIPAVSSVSVTEAVQENLVQTEKESSKLWAKLKEINKAGEAIRSDFNSPTGEYARLYNEIKGLQEKLNAVDYNAEPKIIDGQTIKPSYEASIIKKQVDTLKEKRRVLEKDLDSKTDPLDAEYRDLQEQAQEAEVVEFEESYDNPIKSDGPTPTDYSGFLARMPREGRDNGYSGRDMVLLHAKEIVGSSLKNEEKLDLLNQISGRVQSGVLGNQASDLLKLYRKRIENSL